MVKNVLSVALCFFLKACVNIRLKDLVNLVHKRRKMGFSILGNEYACWNGQRTNAAKHCNMHILGLLMYDYIVYYMTINAYIYIYTCIILYIFTREEQAVSKPTLGFQPLEDSASASPVSLRNGVEKLTVCVRREDYAAWLGRTLAPLQMRRSPPEACQNRF